VQASILIGRNGTFDLVDLPLREAMIEQAASAVA